MSNIIKDLIELYEESEPAHFRNQLRQQQRETLERLLTNDK